MFPVHQFELHPHKRNGMQWATNLYPSFDAIPPQMRSDPDRLYCQSWPCNSSYTCPVQFHGCCQCNQFPGYHGLRCPHDQRPSPCYHGNYPVTPAVYPIHYIPPHHAMELPRYEYDKDMGGHYHCCWCSNNPCNGNGGKSVTIEEATPHSENKVDESSIPFNLRNHQDPLVWYSPSNMKTRMGERTNDPQYEKLLDGSQRSKAPYPHPVLWFPPNQIVNEENNNSNEPMSEKQEGDTRSARKNYPYPILWFPPTYMSNKEENMSNEPQDEKQEGSFDGSKTSQMSKPSEQQQDFLSGWFPFDINKLRPPKSSEGQQIQCQGDDKPGFPCPVFWIPSKPDEKGTKHREGTGVGQECTQRTPSISEVSPAMIPAAEGNNGSEINDEIIDQKCPNEMAKKNILKIIPVKQAEPEEGEKNEEKAKSPEMPSNCSGAGKSSEDGGKRKSPSPIKSSKLPPVCLRVEPLPRKKNTNGSSKSPSLPGDKGKSKEVSGENVKPATSLDVKGITQPGSPAGDVMQKRDQDTEQCKNKTKTIQVSEGTGIQEGNRKLLNSSPKGILARNTNYEPRDTVDDLSVTAVKCKTVTGANCEGAVKGKSTAFSCQTNENEEKSKEESANMEETKRITLSEAEAARIIQSAYRGYEVRRWQPLKKLKQVMEVRKKVAELKTIFQAFESSPDNQDVDKWRAVVGETIMNLLLKLDTIQGMHPSIRDVRKSVAKELVSLQEKVDHLTQKRVEKITQQTTPVLCTENRENKDKYTEKEEHENSQSELDPVNEFHQEVASEAESNLIGDVMTNSGNLDTPEIKDDRENRESITGANSTGTELQKGDFGLDAFTNSQNRDMSTIGRDEGENSEPTSKASYAESELENRAVFPQVDEQVINPAVGWTCFSLENEESKPNEPKGELSEDICILDNHVQNEPGEDGTPGGEVLNELPKGVPDENTDIQDNYLIKKDHGADKVLAKRDLESDELAQLPQGVLDDNNSESKMHLHVEEEEEKSKTNAIMGDFDAGGANSWIPDINQLEPRQEMTPKELLTSEANGSLGCTEDEDNNVQLPKMVDHGSEDHVQALEEEWTVKSMAVGEPEMVHGKEQTRSNAEVFNDKSGVSGYFATENEIGAFATATDSTEDTETFKEKAAELSFVERENACESGGDDEPTDSENSSNKDESQECDLPVKLSKSCDVEHEEKQLDDNFELQGPGGPAWTDRPFVQTGNSGALEGELVSNSEYGPLKAKQTQEDEVPLSSSSPGQISPENDALLDGDKKLIEENMRLREMMQKLIEAGQEQLTAISNLSSRVKDLEKRISKKKKLKVRQNGTSRSFSASSCLKPSNDPQKAIALAI